MELPTIYVLDENYENRFTPILLYKVGFEEVYLSRTCFPNDIAIKAVLRHCRSAMPRIKLGNNTIWVCTKW